jgi:hypothetical protein
MNDTDTDTAVIEVKQEKQFNHPEAIFEYIRRRKGGQVVKRGVMLGFRVDNEIRIGYSLCNSGKNTPDDFNSEVGIELARVRACNETPSTVPIPSSIRNEVRQFSSRCMRYFKDARTLVIM